MVSRRSSSSSSVGRNSTARFRPACSSRSCMRRLYRLVPRKEPWNSPCSRTFCSTLVSRTLPPTSSCRDSMKEARSSLDSSPCATRRSTRILMLTSRSLVSTPAELSIASVLRMTPLSAASIRPSWVKPRLPPSPTILARRSLPLTRSASLALSPTCALVSVEAFT